MLSKLNNSRLARLITSLVLTIAVTLTVSLTLDGIDQAIYGIALTFIGSLAFQILYDLLDFKLMQKSFFAFVRAILFWILTLISTFMSFMLASIGSADPDGSSFLKISLILALTVAPSVNALVYTVGAQKRAKHSLVVIYPVFSILISIPMGIICVLLIQLNAPIFGALAPAAMVVITLLMTLSKQRKKGLIFVKTRDTDVSEKSAPAPNTPKSVAASNADFDDGDDEDETDDRTPDFSHSELIDIIESHYPNSSWSFGSFSLDTSFSTTQCDPIGGIVIYVSESLEYTSALSLPHDEITASELERVKDHYRYAWKNELNSISDMHPKS